MEFFRTPNSKTIIATLRVPTIVKSDLAILLKLYFHGFSKSRNSFEEQNTSIKNENG